MVFSLLPWTVNGIFPADMIDYPAPYLHVRLRPGLQSTSITNKLRNSLLESLLLCVSLYILYPLLCNKPGNSLS